MTTNLVLAYINRADSATLTANPVADAAAPVEFLQSDSRGYPFAAAASGSQEIKGTWSGTAYTIGMARLERTNLADGDTWRIQLYSDAAWTTQVYDSAAAAPFGAGLYANWSYSVAELFFTPVANVKSFKITVVSAAIFRAARLFVGPYYTAQYNPGSIHPKWIDASETDSTEGGSLASMVRPMRRVIDIDTIVSAEADRASYDEAGMIAGTNKSIVVSTFQGQGGTLERDHSVMGKVDGDPISVKLDGYNNYTVSFSVKGL